MQSPRNSISSRIITNACLSLILIILMNNLELSTLEYCEHFQFGRDTLPLPGCEGRVR